MEAALLGLSQANPHCTISTDTEKSAEIRTKVFRMGAPLLRSTIPVSLGRSATTGSLEKCSMHLPAGKAASLRKVSGHNCYEEDDDEDVETVLSLSDAEVEDQGHISVTLDFPC